MPLYLPTLNAAEVLASRTNLAGSAERYGVDYNATAAQNVARMNQCLVENRLVTLTKPGQYLFGGSGQGGILVPSNTAIVIGHGVELIVANATFQPLIRNLNAHDIGTTLASGIVYGGGGHGYTGTINHTGIAALHPVGSWIAIGGLDQSDGNNKGYHGVYRVYSSSGPNSITYNMTLIPPSGGNSQPGAVIRVANSNIRILGGLWNGNDTGNSGAYNDGDPRQFVVGTRNVHNVIVDGLALLRGDSWAIGPNNVTNGTFRNLTGELLGNTLQTANAIIQGAGGSRNILIENVQGDCEDNMVAWSLDSMTGGSVSYPNYDNGDVYGLTIKNVNSTNNYASIVALWANEHTKFRDVLVDGVSGRCNQAAVQVLGGYAPTAMNKTSGTRLQIRNISGIYGAPPIAIASEGDWDHIEINGVNNSAPVAGGIPLVKVYRNSAITQTIRRLTIKNLQGLSTIDRTGPAVEIGDSNIDNCDIEGLPNMRLSAGVSLIQHIGTLGSIRKITVANAHATAAASGDCFVVSCENTNSTAIGRLTVRDCGFTGVDATGGLVRQAATGRVTRIRSDNNTMVNGENAAGIVRDNGTNPAPYDTVNVTTTT